MTINTRLRDEDGSVITYDTLDIPAGSPFVRSSAGELFDIPVDGYAFVAVQIFGDNAMTAAFTQTMAGSTWHSAEATVIDGLAARTSSGVGGIGTLQIFEVYGARRFRCIVSGSSWPVAAHVSLGRQRRMPPSIIAIVGGQANDTNAIRGGPVPIGGRAATSTPSVASDGNAVFAMFTTDRKQIVLTGAHPASTWNYAAASGGITDTTAVTIKAAAGSGIRIYLSSLQVFNSAATASEFSIRDGSSGTVLFRGYAAASMITPSIYSFDPPLRGTANTLMEVVMATTATATRINAQGWTGA